MFVEWLQSLPGIITMSFGTLSLGSAIGTVVSTVNSLNKSKNLAQVMGVLKETQVSISGLKTTVEEKNLQLAQKDVELIQKDSELIQKNAEVSEQAEVQALLLKSVSVMVASSSGIDAVSKLSLTNELEAARIQSIEKAKNATALIEQKTKEFKDVIAEKTKLSVEEFNKEVQTKVNENVAKAKAATEKTVADLKTQAENAIKEKIAQAGVEGNKAISNALGFVSTISDKYKKK